MNPITFNPINLPPVLPQKPITLPPFKPLTPFVGNSLAMNHNIKQMDQSKTQNKKPIPTIYEKIFGQDKYGTGKRYTEKSYWTGWLKRQGQEVHGLKTAMKKYQRNRSGIGKHLSDKDKEIIGNEIGNALQKLPFKKNIDDQTEALSKKYRKKIFHNLYEFKRKHGVLSTVDLKAAKKIIGNIKI